VAGTTACLPWVASTGLVILYAYDDAGVDEAIAAGRLKRIMTEWSPTLPGLFLYYSGRRSPTPALRAFIDCLVDRHRPRRAAASRR
jgi:DNA-binding transcriptional LysR family regulator